MTKPIIALFSSLRIFAGHQDTKLDAPVQCLQFAHEPTTLKRKLYPSMYLAQKKRTNQRMYTAQATKSQGMQNAIAELQTRLGSRALRLGDQLLVADGNRRRDDGAGDPWPPVLLQPLDARQLPHDLRLLPTPRWRPRQRAERPEVVAGLVVPEYGAPGAVRRQVAQRLERVRRVEEGTQRAFHHRPRLGAVRVEPEQRGALGQKRVPRRRAAVRLQDVRGAHGRVQRPVRVEARVGAEHPVESLQHRDGVARVPARERPGHDVPVHGHAPDVLLAHAQRLQHAPPAAEHGGRAERDHRVERLGRHHPARHQHQADQHGQAPAEGVAREPQPRAPGPAAPVVRGKVGLDLRQHLLVDALGGLVDAAVHEDARALELGGLEQEVGLPRRQRVGALDDEAPGARVRLVAREPLARRGQRRAEVARGLLPRRVLGGHHRRHRRRRHVRGHARVVQPAAAALPRVVLLLLRRAEREQAARAGADVGCGRRGHLVGEVGADRAARLRAGGNLVRRRGARPGGVRVKLGAYDAGLGLLLQRRRHEPQPVVLLQLLDLKSQH
ncbi:unnamed protein product [Urochloa decumbens]|uniref:Uncharacterized protein n=1 Tax=Urochloa decumbens TaxID=240449 RepID=A0ABC8YTE5_9POAL